MKLVVNFESEEYPETELSVSEIMRRRKFSFPHVITRLNGTVVEKAARDSIMVQNGDDLEVYHLISGG
jgi:thiamine biosynthesis protein ThiS